MSAYQPGRSMSVSRDGFTLLHTVDQRLMAYDADGNHIGIHAIPRETMDGLLAQMTRLDAIDAAERKVAWRQRWLCLFGTKQALYHNVDLSPEAGYEVVIQDGEQTLKPRTDMDGDERRQTENLDEAQVVSSEALDAHLGPDMHRPILDIDFPVHVYPSTTEGHNHLYFDRLITWEKYEALLQALADAEILEPGYVSASLARKHTAVRLPWVKKEARPDA